MTRLILIRHGQTEWNRTKRYCGFTDVPLNSQGKNQAQRLGRKLRKLSIDNVYSSDRLRAVQSAEIIFPGRKIGQVGDLKEVSFGVFEGLNYKQIMAKYPRTYEKWLRFPYGMTIPQGESLAVFGKRVSGAFKKLLVLNKGKTFAVVCHGGSISVFINKIFKTRDFWKHIPDSMDMIVIEYRDGSRTKVDLPPKKGHFSIASGTVPD
jgi:broad specificity phosphatase PhoE